MYKTGLSLLKEHVLLFQSNKAMIHLVYDKLQALFMDFSSIFINPGVLI